jgi:formylglycine-generating enzyme required for sulfatase activity
MSQLSPDLEKYLRTVRDAQLVLDFSIFQEGQERDFSSVSLQEFYVPLRLAGRPPDEAEDSPLPGGGREGVKERRQERADLRSTQMLDPEQRLGRHLALLGDAGSGKTTILRQLTGALAHAALTRDAVFAAAQTGAPTAELVPIFVPLRYYHHFCRQNDTRRAIALGSFAEFLPHFFRERYDLPLPADFFRELLHSGRALLALDGFDEVPDPDSRRQVLEVVRRLAAGSESGRNTIILSSRVAAYGGATHLGGSFNTLWVQHLNAGERQAQVEQWVSGIKPKTQRDLKAGDILRRMPDGSPLAELAVTPMIVTTLCVVYFYDHELPEQRAQLYRRCVDIMLYEKLRPDEPGQALADKPEFKRQLLARLAFEMHLARKEAINKEQAIRWLQDGIRNLAEEQREPAARAFVESITSRGTLVQERDKQYGFGRQHLTFKEFLAGYHLILGLRSRERAGYWPQILLDDRWREPIRLAAGTTVLDNTLTCEDFLHELLDLSEAAADPASRLAGYRLAAESLWDLGQSGRALIDQELRRQIVTGLAARLLDKTIADPAANLLTARVAGGLVLGRLGDPRPGVTTLPPRMTGVIAGKFLYDDKKEERETAPFRASVYPITNAQFKLFIEAGGYANPDWWSAEGQKWLAAPPDYRNRPITQPEYWDDPMWNAPNQPVVGVTWYEAEAFCHWLSEWTNERMGENTNLRMNESPNGDPVARTQSEIVNPKSKIEFRLPTEAEWERLARGQHGREYPWGNAWEAGICNTGELGVKQTTPVGLFPAGESPTGAYDCAGNVWEWGADWYDKDEDGRVLRGGSWDLNQVDARCAIRRRFFPNGSSYDLGFRVVSPILGAEF